MIVRLTPHETIIEAIQAEARERLARVPEAVVVNASALLTLLQPRVFQLGGVGYRAPPVSFANGVRLLVAANALRDLRVAEAPDHQVAAAARLARQCARAALRPRRRWGVLRPGPIRDLSLLELEGLLRWLTHVPDDGASVLPTGKTTIDWMDELAGFVAAYPAWVGADGLPRFWAQYIYGVRHLGRDRHRQDLRLALATRASQYTEKDFRDFQTEHRAAAGWL